MKISRNGLKITTSPV